MKAYNSIWFSSDWHFCHDNILKYCSNTRGHYSNIEEMNEDIIKNINAKVSKGDILYFLGDFGFCKNIDDAVKIIERINCDIFFIKGNHDRKVLIKKIKALPNIVGVEDLHSIKIDDPDAIHGKQMIVMCHYPLEVWDRSHYGALMIHGHSHGTLPVNLERMRLDVGIDCNNMQIFSYEDIKLHMFNRSYVPVDHHDSETN